MESFKKLYIFIKKQLSHIFFYTKWAIVIFFDIAEDIIETEMLFAACIRLKSFPWTKG